MKSGILTCITVISLLAVLAMPLRLAAQVEKQEHRRYRVIDLGTLGGPFSEPHGINNEDWVAGFSTLKGDQNTHAFLWRHGHMTDLGTLGGPNSVGWVPRLNPNFLRAVLWRDGTVTDLGNLGGSMNNFAFDINNQDQVVGDSDLPGDTVQHAFLWTEDDGMQDLGTLPGDTGS
jgi:probable HAF family extracellular repeat protein